MPRAHARALTDMSARAVSAVDRSPLPQPEITIARRQERAEERQGVNARAVAAPCVEVDIPADRNELNDGLRTRGVGNQGGAEPI